MCVVNKVLFFAVIIIAFTYSLIKDCPNKQTLWLDHKHSFDDFSCDVPKPLTIPTVELFSESAAKILKLDPWFTVLHRYVK